jgi:hypothetical protein
LVVPVVSQETYFVRVTNMAGDTAIGYDLELENFSHNVPQVWGIDPQRDSGWSNNDAITAEPRPTILIQADLDEAIAAGIPIRPPGAAPGPGMAVEVILTDLENGDQFVDFAAPFGPTSDWFSYTPAASSPLSSGVYAVTAAVRTFDGASLGGVPTPASGRSARSTPFTLIVDRVAPIAADQPDMLSASDTGRSTVDQITRTPQPAFRGNGEPLSKVRVYANRIGGEIEVVGQGMTNSDGSWEVTVEPLDDDIYHIRAEFEDRAGNVSSVGEPLLIEVDTRAPNTPLLDLIPADDSGLTPRDNITRLTSPSFSMTTHDPAQEAHWIRFNYNYRVYLRPDAGDASSAAEILLYDSLQDTAIPPENLLEGLTDLEQLVRQLGPLPEGMHELKLEVEDRAGNISEDYLLTVQIDTTPPMTEFELLPSSDSGGRADDAVTNVRQPAFAGRTEPGATVNLFANGRFVGRAQAGSDASDGLPEDGLAVWEITAEPLVDGAYEITVQIEDLAGNEAESDPLTVIIDAAAPNLPYLDLITDNGISDTDNITDTNTPVFTITASDRPEGGPNPFPHDIKYRLYDRPNSGGEILIADSFAMLGVFSEEGFFTFTSPSLADGVHNLKLEIEDRAGNVSLPFTLQVEIITSLPQIDPIDLADYSDSGMSNTDNVTGIAQPAIIGVGSVGDTVLIRANGVLVGKGVVNSDVSDGVPDNGLGAWEITLEPLDDDVYEIVASIEDAAGNVVDSSPLIIEIDTLEPNTPRLDLVEADDLGRHNDDNITSAEDIAFSATAHDPNAEHHVELFPDGQNFKFRIYLRGEQADEVLLYDSAVDPALTDLLDGLTAASQILTPELDLPEGLLNLKLEVEDRAGNISHDFLLDVLVDRVSFPGTVLLHPDSDSGVVGLPATFSDNVTNVRTPWLTGRAEANSLVIVTIDGQAAGTAVAIPWDGDDAVQPPEPPYELQGNWLMQSAVGLADGVHEVLVTFEDPAGNRATAEMSLTIDTAGPRIVNVTRNEPGFPSVFDPKPTSGPDPLIDSLVIHFTDLPILTGGTTGGSLAETLLAEEGNYQVVGDANGNIPVVSVEIDTNELPSGTVVTTATLFFNEPLPDDRFTLTVSDAISDLAGNRLDGESGAGSPFEGQPGPTGAAPVFPSGDGVPGGSFVARFTVDSRPEIGTWAAGSAWIDINGNWRFDPENTDFVNRDLVFRYGFASDDLIAGNFALPGETTDGFDKLAAYGRAEGEFRWLVDTDNDGVPNIDRVEPQAVNGLPVAGRFDGNADNGDEVGLFNGTHWFFDTDHDFRTDTRLRSRLVGYPIVGDFDGDGFDDLATWTDNRFMIDLAEGTLRGWDGVADQVFTFGFIGVRERPVAADMNQDGFDDLGLWVPDRTGVTDRDQSEWYFLISEDEPLIDRFSPPDDPIDSRPVIDFTPRPFGPDLYARFGDEFALPIVGNFDPPTLRLNLNDDRRWTNPENALDVNQDGDVSPLDALLVVNHLNQSGARALAEADRGTDLIDVNGDRYVSPLDALLVVNELNRINYLKSLVGQPLTAVAADPKALTETGQLIDAVFADKSIGADDLSLVLAALDDALARRPKR